MPSRSKTGGTDSESSDSSEVFDLGGRDSESESEDDGYTGSCDDDMYNEHSQTEEEARRKPGRIRPYSYTHTAELIANANPHDIMRGEQSLHKQDSSRRTRKSKASDRARTLKKEMASVSRSIRNVHLVRNNQHI